jgi:hypothetical protein
MTLEEIKAKLFSKKSADRRRAAKEIGKSKIYELADDLYQRYLDEIKDNRTWETQCEMIKALGILNYKQAIEQIEIIVNQNTPHDTITIFAATTYVQLTRESINDAKPILDLFKFGSVSVIHGAVLTLAVDKMTPNPEEIKEILHFCRDINKHKDRIGHEYGLMDVRRYVAIACANWDKTLTIDFLNHCIDTCYEMNSFNRPMKNVGLVEVCQNSLKGKFSKAYL